MLQSADTSFPKTENSTKRPIRAIQFKPWTTEEGCPVASMYTSHPNPSDNLRISSWRFTLEGLRTMSAPHFLATSNFQSCISRAMRHLGDFCLAPATIPRPSGPHPDTTTISLNWMFPNSTAWREHAKGSTKQAWNGSTVLGTLPKKKNCLKKLQWIAGTNKSYRVRHNFCNKYSNPKVT